MRRILPVLFLLSGLLIAPSARALELPARADRAAGLAAPARASDRLTVQLTPAAASRARSVRALSAGTTVERTGVASVDAAATELGAWLEPEFRGETPPPPGSPDADFTSFYVAHLPRGGDLESALARFRSLPEVSRAEPIAVLPVSVTPNDSLESLSWWHEQLSGCDIHTPAAWDLTTGDSSIVIAILDTGVLPYHPDLGGTVAGASGQIWTNRAEANGAPGVDDDGNGFVDDVHGWDFVNLDPTELHYALTGEDAVDEDNDPNDYSPGYTPGHGTVVAGLADAIADNGIGIAGVAWHARLMPLRVAVAESGGYESGAVYMDFVARAVRYATRMGANVINCSFESAADTALSAALDAAARAGVIVVVAAGNRNPPLNYIGERGDAVAVAGTDMLDNIYYTSALAPWVDLAAPGAYLLSTAVTKTGSDSLGYRQPSYTESGVTGTSFAAPLVSGTVALVQSRQKALALRPLTPMGMKLRLRETADDISALNPTVTGYGSGRLNAWRALADPVGSTAWRAGAASVGPAVPIPLEGPARKLAYVTEDAKLLIEDWRTGDTLALTPLPGPPARQLAAADLGGGRGIGLFVGTRNGALAGFDTSGVALAGFPVTTGGSGAALGGGPALGDVNGDGALEIVCGADDGKLWAWSATGAVLPGFPVATSAAGIGVPVALSDLDGAPGVEIVAATRDGNVYAIRGNGLAVANWPASVSPSPEAPVVTRYGGAIVILVAAGNHVFVLRADGSERASWSLPGAAVSDPALADLDGDGTDEIVVAVGPPNEVAALDSTGAAPAGLGWPLALSSAALGPAVLGHLRGPDDAPDLALMTANGLVAAGDSANTLSILPKPGGAGAWPLLADLLGDGTTRIAAGSGSDQSLYVYGLGAGSAATTPQAWPMPRGNSARTGSRLYLSPDALPPAAVRDLAIDSGSADSVRLTWTATGNDGVVGRAAEVDARFTTFKGEIGSTHASRIAVPAPDGAGVKEYASFPAPAPGVTCWVWLRVKDDAGNVSRSSNVAWITRPLGIGETGAAALSVRRNPTPRPVMLDWSGAAASEIVLYDVSGRRVRRLRLSPASAGTAQWDGRDESGRLVPAGLYFARLIGGSLHTRARVVLLP